MSRGNLWTGFVLGALAGAAVTLLLTPESGSDIQAQVRSRFDTAMEEGRRAAAERRAELEAQFAELKRPARPA